MPTLKELQESMEKTGASQAQRNQQIAQAVKTGVLQRTMGQPEATPSWGPERTAAQNEAVFAGHQQELTPEEAEARLTPTPEEQFGGVVKRMAQNYQTSPQYKELLEQELSQISAQIAELTQRRNMIEMAMRGKA